MVGPIGHFQNYHNTLCCPSKILHKHCFQFLLGQQNNACAKFWRDNKERYGIFENGLYFQLQQKTGNNIGTGCLLVDDNLVCEYCE